MTSLLSTSAFHHGIIIHACNVDTRNGMLLLMLFAEEEYTGWSKNGYPVLFWDNFGNSAPILTILSLLQAENSWRVNVKFFFTHHTFIV